MSCSPEPSRQPVFLPVDFNGTPPRYVVPSRTPNYLPGAAGGMIARPAANSGGAGRREAGPSIGRQATRRRAQNQGAEFLLRQQRSDRLVWIEADRHRNIQVFQHVQSPLA